MAAPFPRRAAWAGAAALSVVAHGWLLTAAPGGGRPGLAGTPARPSTPDSATPESATRPHALVRLAAHTAVIGDPTQPVNPDHAAWATTPPAPALASESTAGITASAQRAGSDYLARRDLSVAPSPRSPVWLNTPATVPDGHYTAELTLFIDETGQVRRVRVDSAGLLPDLEAQARQAFMTTPFNPGEVDGRPVRSRLRVAVAFEARSAARAAGVPTP